MNKVKKKGLIAFLLLPTIFFGQVEQKESVYYDWFDNVLGQEHLGLHNGKQYVDYYVGKIIDNKHQFFNSNKVLKGDITYGGQSYYNLGMKYNLEIDKVIVELKSSHDAASVLQLIDEKIERFTIEGHNFINIDESNETISNGFYEVLVENLSFTLFKKHKVRRNDKMENHGGGNRTYYKFRSDNVYILYTNNEYTIIKNKTDFVNVYPDLKKEIKQFYTINRNLKKTNLDEFMLRLFDSVVQPLLLKNEL